MSHVELKYGWRKKRSLATPGRLVQFSTVQYSTEPPFHLSKGIPHKCSLISTKGFRNQNTQQTDSACIIYSSCKEIKSLEALEPSNETEKKQERLQSRFFSDDAMKYSCTYWWHSSDRDNMWVPHEQCESLRYAAWHKFRQSHYGDRSMQLWYAWWMRASQTFPSPLTP
jgi:hypothetical protein